MTLLSEEDGLVWQSGVATLKGTQIKLVAMIDLFDLQ